MGLEYSISHEESLIKVSARGRADYLSIDQMWKDIAATCKARNCFVILGVSKLDTPISTTDAYDHENIFRSAGIGVDHRIAWVDTNPATADSFEMVGAVLSNRGLLNGRFFTRVNEARAWLEENSKTTRS